MVEIESPYVAYDTDGSQTQFDITFEYTGEEPLNVILVNQTTEEEETLVVGTDYVVEGSDTVGWSVRTIEAYPDGYGLYIIRDSDQVQESDYVENDPLPADRLETDYDSAIKMVQELQRKIDRCLKLRRTAGDVNIEMADPIDGYVLRYDSSTGRYEAVNGANLSDYLIQAFMAAFLESVDVDEARTHLGGDADWHEIGGSGEPVFENGWGNYGGGYEELAFRLDSSGFVHLKGRTTGGEADTVVFTLPINYRPAKTQVFNPEMQASGRVEIGANGEVTLAT